MKNRNLKILLFIIALLTGFGITSQLRGNFSFQGIITPQKLIEMQTGIENYKVEIETITRSNSELAGTVAKYSTTSNGGDDKIKAMEEELGKIRKMADISQVKGPGIRIILKDSDLPSADGLSENFFLIHDFDILNLVNELKGAGGEAIAINGERVTALTNIVCGGPTIIIDGKRHTPPFVIEAIGEPKKLEAALNKQDSYLDLMKFAGINIQVEVPGEITIAAYNGPEKNKYMKKAGGGK